MTLILGMSKAEGIYLSVDYRVSDSRTGKTLDDKSVKFLKILYDNVGVKFLLAYTGIARLPDGTLVGDWIRETLRGQNEVPDVSMALLRERLNRDIAPLGHPLMVNMVGLQGDYRFLGGFTNVRVDGSIRPDFDYGMNLETAPSVFGNGSGAERVVTDGHYDFLRKQLHVRPRKPLDHMKLLASVNRRVAKVDNRVSPYCHVSFINADDRFEPQQRVFSERGEPDPFHMRIILMGVDLSFIERFHEHFVSGQSDDTFSFDLDEANRQLKRRD